MSIRILIVDDHEVLRAGLRLLLETVADFEVIGEAANGERGLELAQELKPNVVVMDVTMPNMNGIEATQILKTEHPEIAVLALTIHEGQEYFFQMLQAGASGYVPKRAAPDVLIQAIKHVAEGNVFIEPQIAKLLVSDYLQRVEEGAEPQGKDGLSEREQEVLTLIAEDATNQEIANTLQLSVKTIERHRENIMRKLNLHTRTELVKYAIRKGLIKN
jgi:two-component system, NarL family, response regulator NreC